MPCRPECCAAQRLYGRKKDFRILRIKDTAFISTVNFCRPFRNKSIRIPTYRPAQLLVHLFFFFFFFYYFAAINGRHAMSFFSSVNKISDYFRRSRIKYLSDMKNSWSRVGESLFHFVARRSFLSFFTNQWFLGSRQRREPF